MTSLNLFLHNGPEDANPKAGIFSNIFTGDQLLQLACFSLGISKSDLLIVKYMTQYGIECKLDMQRTLQDQGIVNNMHLIICNEQPNNNYSFNLPISDYAGQPSTFDSQFNSVFDSFPQINNNPQPNFGFPQAPQMNFPMPQSNVGFPQAPQMNFPMPQSNVNYQQTQQMNFPMPQLNLPAPQLNLPAPTQTLDLPSFAQDFDLPVFEEFQLYDPTEQQNQQHEEELDVVIKNVDNFDTSAFETSSGFGLGNKDNDCFTIYTYNGLQENTNPPISYKKDFTFNQVVATAREALGLKDSDYSVLLVFSDDDMRWFEPGRFVEDYSCYSGMTLRLFRSQVNIKVDSPHFDQTTVLINIQDTVQEIVKKIAEQQGIVSYLDFTLYECLQKMKEDKVKNIEVPLSLFSDIPHQAKEMKSFMLKRRFLVFSAADFINLDAAENAYMDAFDEIRSSKTLFMTREEAIQLTAYALIIKNDTFDLQDMPSCKKLVPYAYKNESLQKDVEDFLKSLEVIPDKINSIRLFMRIARIIPGFGQIAFSCQYSESDINSIALIAPLDFTLIREDDETTIFRIPYRFMVDATFEDGFANINYRIDREIQTIQISSKHAEDIADTLSTFLSIQRTLLLERAKLRIEGKWHGPVSEVDVLHLEVFDGFNDSDPVVIEMDRSFTGKMAVDIALNKFEINEKRRMDYAGIVCIHKQKKWLDENCNLGQLGIFDGCQLYIVKKIQQVTVTMSDGSNMKMSLNITERISTLIKEIFQNFEQPFVHGYTLFVADENGKMVQLNENYSLPELTFSFKRISMQRRFFYLSRDDMASDTLRRVAFADSRAYFVHHKCETVDDVLIDLTAIALHIDGKKVADIDNKSFNWEPILPLGYKPSSSFKKNVIKKLPTLEQETITQSIKKYIKTIRLVPYFGAETYMVQYRYSDYKKRKLPKTYNDAEIRFCPLNVYLMDQNGKQLYSISWINIIRTKIFRGVIVITFATGKRSDEVVKIDVKTEDISSFLMMIEGSINIFKTMVTQRQKEDAKKKAETIQKLQGGWKDSTGVIHGPMIDINIGTDFTATKFTSIFWMDLASEYKELLANMMRNFKLQPKPNVEYGLLLITPDRKFKWMFDGMKLKDLDPHRKSALFILNIRPIIKIKSATGSSKSLFFNLSLPLQDNLSIVAPKFGINNSLGYTIWKEENNKLVPLELSKTLCEVAPDFQGLVFKRRFYMITRSDFETIDGLWQTFSDIKDLVHSGIMEITNEQATELAVYEFIASMNGPYTEKNLPDDLSKYFPVNIKCSRQMSKEFRAKALALNGNISPDDARRRYVALARSIETFGCEVYKCFYYAEVKGKNVRKECKFYVTPYKIYAVDIQTKKNIFYIQYSNLLNVYQIEDNLSIVYCSNQGELFDNVFESAQSAQIAEVINSYINIGEIILNRIAQNGFDPDEVSSGYRAKVTAIYTKEGRSKKLAFAIDSRCNGKQVATRSTKVLGLNPHAQYSCLLSFAPGYNKWIREDELIGNKRPYDDIKMYVLNRYEKIKVKLYGDSEPMDVSIDITSNIFDLVPEIANRFNIEQSIGYTLFVESTNKPLDLRFTIPEQVELSETFIFRRRFFYIPKYDMKSNFIVSRLLEDFKKHALSGIPLVSESDMLELAVYYIYAHSTDPNKVCEMSFEHIDEFLPHGMKEKPILVQKLNDLLRKTEVLEPSNAARQYIISAKALEGFDIIKTSGIIIEEKSSKEIRFSITSTQATITYKQTKNTIKIALKHILSSECIKNTLRLKVEDEEGDISTLTMNLRDAEEINNFIQQMKSVVIPLVKARETIMRDCLYEVPEPAPDQVPFIIASRFNEENPRTVFFNPSLNKQQIIDYLKKIFFISDNSGYTLIYLLESGLYEFGDGFPFSVTGITPGSIIYFIKKSMPIYVESPQGFITRFIVDMTQRVTDISSEIVSELSLGFEDGYTLYTQDNIPLDIAQTIAYQTPKVYDLAIRRRIYVITKQFFDNSENLESLYNDCRNAVISEKINVSLDQAVLLAIYSVFADIYCVSDFTQQYETRDINSLVPPKYAKLSNVKRKLDATCKAIVPMSREDAQSFYIAETCRLSGFAAEIHEAKFSSTTKESRDCTVVLSPFNIQVVVNSKVVESITYSKIFTLYFNEQGAFVLRFYNENGCISYIEIYSKDAFIISTYLNTLEFYIDKYGGLLSIDEMLEILLKIKKQTQEDQMGNDSTNDDFDESLFITKFNDIDDISIDNINIQFLEENSNYLDEDTLFREPVAEEQVVFELPETASLELVNLYNGEDRTWRATATGLEITRSSNSMNFVEQEFIMIQSSLNSFNAEELNKRLAIIDDAFSMIDIKILNDDQKLKYIKIKDSISQLRETTLMIERTEQDIELFKPILMQQIQPIAKSILDFKQDLVTIEIKESKKAKESSVEEITPVSKSLIIISDLQEACIMLMLSNLDTLRVQGIDTRELIRQLQTSSSALTTLAGNFTSTTDPKIVDQQVIPQLLEIKEIINSIQNLVNSSSGSSSTLIEKTIKKLKYATDTIEESMSKYSLANKQLQGNKNTTVMINTKASNAATLSLIKSNESLSQIQFLAPELKTDIEDIDTLIKQAIVSIAAHRGKSLADVYKTQRALAQMKILRSKLIAKNSPALSPNIQALEANIQLIEDQIHAISLVNIIPRNLEKVVSDAQMLNVRWTNTNTNLWSTLNPETLEFTRKVMLQFNGLTEELNECRKLSDDNIVNGEVLQKQQYHLLKLREIMPDMQKAVEYIYKNTNDASFPVMFERLSTDLDTTLCEPAPVEDLAQVPHIIKFHEAQTAIADTINMTIRINNMPGISRRSDLTAKTHVIIDKLSDFYQDICKWRIELHERPFAREIINGSATALEKSTKLLSMLRLPATEISEITRNNELDQQINDAFNIVNIAIKELNDAPLNVYRIAPSAEQRKALKDACSLYKVNLQKLLQSPEIEGNQAQIDKIMKEIAYVDKQLGRIDALKPNEISQYYAILEKLQRRIENLPSRISSGSTFSVLDITKQAAPQFRILLKGTIPTIDVATRNISETVNPLQLLVSLLNDYSRSQAVIEGKGSLEALQNWTREIENGLKLCQSRAKSNNTLIQLKNDIPSFSNLISTIETIPLPLRSVLTKDELEKLAQLVSSASNCAGMALLSIRNLPTKGTVNADMNLFQRIDSDAEIEDSIIELVQQFNDLTTIVKAISEVPQISSKPHTMKVINDMNNELQKIQADVSRAAKDEKKFEQVLTSIKERLAQISANAELIAPIVNVNNLSEMTKNIMANSNTIIRILSQPHFNQQTAKTFVTSILPALTKLQASIDKQYQTAQNWSNPEIARIFKMLPSMLNQWIVSIKSAKPRQAQQICNEINSTSRTLFTNFIDYPELQDITNDIIEVIEIAQQFSSVQTDPVTFTNALLPQKNIVEESSIKSMAQVISQFLAGSNAQVPQNVLQVLDENLGYIVDTGEQIQPFMQKPAKFLSHAVSNTYPQYVSRSALNIILSLNDYNLRAQLLEDLTIQTFIRVAFLINNLASEVDYVSGNFSQEVQFRLDLLKKALTAADPKLLLKCKSISAAILLFGPMNDVQTACNLLLMSAARENIFDSFKDVSVTFSEYQQWLFEADMCLINNFYGQLDSLFVAIEQSFREDPRKQLPQGASAFIRRNVCILKNKDRLLYINWHDVSKLSAEYIKFNSDVLPQYKSAGVKSKARDQAVFITEGIQKLIPALRIWTQMFNKLDENKFRSICESNLGNLLINASKINNIAADPNIFVVVYNQQKSYLTLATSIIETTEFSPECQQGAVMIQRLLAAIEKSIGGMPQATQQILSILFEKTKTVVEQIVANHKIDFTKLTINDTEKAIDLELITDKDCMKAANDLKKIVENINKMIEATKDQQQEKKDVIRRKLPKSLVLLQPGEGESGFGKLLEANRTAISQFLFQSRVSELQQLLLQLYPDLSKRVDNPQQVAATVQQLDTIDLQRANGEITHMFEIINTPEFAQYTKGLSQDQVFLQILMLRNYANILKNIMIQRRVDSLSVVQALLALNISEEDLQKSDFSKRFDDLGLLQQLESSLVSLLFFLSSNNPKAMKFALTEEGSMLLKQPISQPDLIQHQLIIAQQMSFLDMSESLKLIQTKMTPEDVIKECKIINFALDIVAKKQDISPECTTINQLITEIFQQQLQAIKENPDALGQRFIDINTIENALNFIADVSDKIEFASAALELVGVPAFNITKPPQDQYTKALTEVQQKVDNHDSHPKLSEETIKALLFILTQMGTNEFIAAKLNHRETLASILTTLLSSNESSLVLDNPSDLIVVSPSAGIQSGYARNNLSSTSLMNAIKLNALLSSLRAANPQIKGEVKQEQISETIDLLMHLLTLPMNQCQQQILSLKPEQQQALFAIAQGSLNSLSNVEGRFLNADSRQVVFDKAALLAIQTKGTPDPLTKEEAQKLIPKVEKHLKTLVLSDKLSRLNSSRIELSDVSGKVTATISKSSLKEELAELKKQYELLSQDLQLENLLSSYSPEEIAMQQTILSSLAYTSLSSEATTIDELIAEQEEKVVSRIPSGTVMELIKQISLQTNFLYDLLNLAVTMSDFTKGRKAGSYSIKEFADAQETINIMLTLSQPQLISFLATEPIDKVVCQAAQVAELVSVLMQNEFKSILALPVNIPDFDLSIRSTTEVPSLHQILVIECQATNSLLRMIPSMSMVSISECKSILASESQTVIALLKRLLQHKGTSYTPDAATLVQVIPQLAAAMIRVITSLPSDVQKAISISGTDLIQIASSILNASIDLSDQKNMNEMHSSIIKLMIAVACANAVCSNEFDINSIDALANLKMAIDEQDVDDLTQCLIDLKSIKSRGNKNDLSILSQIQRQIDVIEPIIFNLHSSQQELSQEAKQKLQQLKPMLVKIVSDRTSDPLKEIYDVKTIKQVRENILNRRAEFQESVNLLVRGVSHKDQNIIYSSIKAIINNIAMVQTDACRSLSISNCSNFSVYTDMITKFVMSISALKTIQELATDPSANATMVRRSTRSLNRMMDSLIDQLEDADSQQWKDKPKKALDIAKLNMIQTIRNTIQLLMSIVASKEVARIPETFQEAVSKCMPQFKACIEELKKRFAEVEKENADKSAFIYFNSAFDSLMKSLDSFGNGVSTTTMMQLTDILGNVASSITEVVSTLGRLTDVVAEVPDLEAADLLPTKFEMPPVPSGSGSLAEYSQTLSSMVNDYSTANASFIEVTKGKNNKQSAQSMNELSALMLKTIEQILRVSSATTTLRIQNQLTNSASSLVNNFDALIKALRNKFLLRGDWSQSTKIITTIDEELKSTVSLSSEAVEIAKKEEMMNDAMTTKLLAVLKPLQAITSSVDAKLQEVQLMENSITKEWSVQVLTLGNALGKSASKIILHSKDHPSPQSAAHAEFGSTVTEGLTSLSEAVNKIQTQGANGEPEAVVIEIMKQLSKICTDFSKNTKIEDSALLEAVTIAGRTANRLISTAENVLEAKRAAKAKAAAAPGAKVSISSSKNTQSKAQLLKRLELESRVIRARAILERSEAKIRELN